MSSDPRPSLNLMKGSARRTSTQLGPQSREKGNGNPKNFPRLGCQGKRAFLLTPQQRPWGQLWSRVLTLSAQLLLDFHGRHLLLSVLSSNATSAEGVTVLTTPLKHLCQLRPFCFRTRIYWCSLILLSTYAVCSGRVLSVLFTTHCQTQQPFDTYLLNG